MINKIDVVVGLQYGDESKGKVVDAIADKYDVMVRFQGGANSGHTVYTDDGHKLVFNMIPSGIVRKNILAVITAGVVIDPLALSMEINRALPHVPDLLERLLVSADCHITFPSHRLVDMYSERKRIKNGEDIIGSTCRGNTPTYVDKMTRRGITLRDMVSKKAGEIYMSVREEHDKMIDWSIMEAESSDIILDGMKYQEYEAKWLEALTFLKRVLHIRFGSIPVLMNKMHSDGKAILLESAQGLMLDLDHGTYPFVTSTSVTTAAAFHQTGLPIQAIGRVFGVFKPYITRVGRGFFPTELVDSEKNVEEQIVRAGHEYGSVSGRRRRIGWLDLPSLKYACMVNCVTDLILAKMDVLDGVHEVKVCTEYAYDDGLISSEVYDGQEGLNGFHYTSYGHFGGSGVASRFGDLCDGAQKLIYDIESVMSNLYNAPTITRISCSPDKRMLMHLKGI